MSLSDEQPPLNDSLPFSVRWAPKQRSNRKRPPSKHDFNEDEELVKCLVNLSRLGNHINNNNSCISTDSKKRRVVQEEVPSSSSSHICSVCNKSFSSGQALGGHMSSHNSNGRISPSTPPVESKKRRVVQEEVTSSSSSHICSVCNKSFSSGQALGGHMSSDTLKKPVALEDLPNKDVHQCPVCDRVFESGQALGGHMSSHTHALKKPTIGLTRMDEHKSGAVHKCSECGQNFETGQALGGHMREHSARPAKSPPTSEPASENVALGLGSDEAPSVAGVNVDLQVGLDEVSKEPDANVAFQVSPDEAPSVPGVDVALHVGLDEVPKEPDGYVALQVGGDEAPHEAGINAVEVVVNDFDLNEPAPEWFLCEEEI